MGCQQGKAQTAVNKDVNGGGGGSKSGLGRTATMKNGNAQKLKDEEQDQDKNESYVDESKNENGITNDDKQNLVIKSKSQSINDDAAKQKNNQGSPEKQKASGQSEDNPPLKYTFTINGKSQKQIEEQQDDEEDNNSDVLLSTEIREGITPQLSEEDEYLQQERIYDKKDISLADIGDGLFFDNGGGIERKMTLHKAATLKKSATLKQKMEKKQIIHALDIQPSRDYFMPDFSKQFTRQASQKNYSKATTLFVPQSF